MNDFTEAFRQAMNEAGVITSVPIIAGNKITRFDVETEDDKPGSKTGWYIFFDGEVPGGAFGCWKRGIKRNWCSKSRNRLSPKERDQVKKRNRETKILRKQEQAKIWAEARKEADRIWNESSAVQSHEYLRNKGVKAFGIREHNGKLIVPMKDSQGILNSLQSISSTWYQAFPAGRED